MRTIYLVMAASLLALAVVPQHAEAASIWFRCGKDRWVSAGYFLAHPVECTLADIPPCDPTECT